MDELHHFMLDEVLRAWRTDVGHLNFYVRGIAGEPGFDFVPRFEFESSRPYVVGVAVEDAALSANPLTQKNMRDALEDWADVMAAYFQFAFHRITAGLRPYPRFSEIDALMSLPVCNEERARLEAKLAEFTFIYLIRDRRTGLIKIGKSGDPEARLRQLTRESTLLPEPLDFVIVKTWRAHQAVEKGLHDHFGHRRVRGEWFQLSDAEIKGVEEFEIF